MTHGSIPSIIALYDALAAYERSIHMQDKDTPRKCHYPVSVPLPGGETRHVVADCIQVDAVLAVVEALLRPAARGPAEIRIDVIPLD